MINVIKKAKGFLFDLDGVFIQSGRLLSGAVETHKILCKHKIPFRFLTNTTTKSKKTLHKLLTDQGLNCKEEEIFSAGSSGVHAIKNLGSPKCRLYISEDLKKDYIEFQEDRVSPDLIVVGDYSKWDFNLLNQAFRYVMNGAQILALHTGRYYKVDSGLQLDAGAFVKGLEFATGKTAFVVGKPNVNFFQSALSDLKLMPDEVVMVGDDLVNDIYGAQELNIFGVLVKTGKYHLGMLESSNIKPNGIINSIGDIGKIISN